MTNEKINILFTGYGGNDSDLTPLFDSERVNFINFPTIEIVSTNLTSEEEEKIKTAENYDYLIFTSANGVRHFIQHYDSNFSNLSKTKVVAIGRKTASLLINNNIDVDLIPQNSSSESIAELLTENLVCERSILVPGSTLSKPDLCNSLETKGAMVDFVAIYDNKIPSNIPEDVNNYVKEGNIDMFVFTSPSTFHNFISIFEIDNIQNYFSDKVIAVIGPVTKEVIEKENLIVRIIPSKYNLDSLTDEIINYYKLN